MTAGLYMPTDWPQRVEELSARRGRPIDVLNFAVDGGGVMNWWSIITHIIAKENYQLDDCLFAVCCDDLSRGLFIRHDDFDGSQHRPWFRRVRGIRQIDLPNTLEEARRHAFILSDDPGLSPAAMDQLLASDQPAMSTPIRSRLIKVLLVAALIHHFQPQGLVPGTMMPSEEMLARYQEMQDGLSRLGVRIWVVQVPMPSIGQANQFDFATGIADGTRKFAEVMKSTPIDGGEAFGKLTKEEIRQHFLDGDPHWNQQGADRFADFIETMLAQPTK